MTAMPPLRDILNDTEANAVDVDHNFGLIEAHIGQELINRDGSVAMTGPLTTQPPTAPAHAATKAYVDNNIPVGSITMFAGGPGAVLPAPQTVPAGWALCDGSLKGTADPLYAALFAVIGYTYGGTGGNFNLPNLQSRMPVGRQAGDAVFGALGGIGGNRNATLPVHQHDIAHGHGDSIGISLNDANTDHFHKIDHDHPAFATDASQGNHAHQFPTVNGSGTGPGSARSTSTTTPASNQATEPAGLHGHIIEVPNFEGNSNWQSQVPGSDRHSHNHGVNKSGGVTSAPAGTLSNQQGVDPANANLPPYITINFLIRIG